MDDDDASNGLCMDCGVCCSGFFFDQVKLSSENEFESLRTTPDIKILDKNVGAEFTYDQGPFSIGAYADMDGDKSLNANYTRNNSNYSFDLNDGGGQLKFTRTFANGGLAGLL